MLLLCIIRLLEAAVLSLHADKTLLTPMEHPPWQSCPEPPLNHPLSQGPGMSPDPTPQPWPPCGCLRGAVMLSTGAGVCPSQANLEMQPGEREERGMPALGPRDALGWLLVPGSACRAQTCPHPCPHPHPCTDTAVCAPAACSFDNSTGAAGQEGAAPWLGQHSCTSVHC